MDEERGLHTGKETVMSMLQHPGKDNGQEKVWWRDGKGL